MDDSKNSILIAVAVFCMVVMGFQVLFNWGDNFGVLKMLEGFVLGTIAAGIAFGLVAAMKK
jgi:hypothetical protein